MVKSLATFCLGLLAFGFASCDDELDVMQAYPFTVETMSVPKELKQGETCLLYTSPSPRDRQKSRMPSSA